VVLDLSPPSAILAVGAADRCSPTVFQATAWAPVERPGQQQGRPGRRNGTGEEIGLTTQPLVPFVTTSLCHSPHLLSTEGPADKSGHRGQLRHPQSVEASVKCIWLTFGTAPNTECEVLTCVSRGQVTSHVLWLHDASESMLPPLVVGRALIVRLVRAR
jgi:hypothetical protein